MGSLNDLPNNSEPRLTSSEAEDILQSVTQNLQDLQQSLVVQLQQDIGRLQAEKSQLLNDIEELRIQQQSMQVEQRSALSQRQLEQQQIWAKQMAQSLANHLQALMMQRLNQMGYLPGADPVNDALPSATPPAAQRMLMSFDASLNRTLTSLSKDLNSYQSTLSQQIGRMQNLQQQGEVILEVLVNRLSRQLQADLTRSHSAHNGNGDRSPSLPTYPTPSAPRANGQVEYSSANPSIASSTIASPTTASPTTPTQSSPPPKRKSILAAVPLLRHLTVFQKGLLFMVGSTLALSLHNVVVGIVGRESQIFNLFSLGGYIDYTIGNSMLLLLLRMLIVVPLLISVATVLYPKCWQDIKNFLQSNDRKLMGSVIGTGFFLFLSQISIYVAIGGVGPGVAVTILFMYPIITVPLAWLLFGDRPTRLRWAVMLTIVLGVVLTSLPKIFATDQVAFNGIIAAVLSGLAFAFYVITTQLSTRKLHPVPVSVIQFATIFLLTGLSLIFLPNDTMSVAIAPEGRWGFLIGGLILGALTLLGYLMNNFGIGLLGAASAAIFSSSGPVVTAFLDFVVRQVKLEGVQWLGILIVTLGLIGLAYEKRLSQRQATKPTVKKA